jgi:DNA-binding NtrC family response regulator
MGEHVDTDDSGVGRQTGDNGAFRAEDGYSESIIRADIAWRGSEAKSFVGPKLRSIPGRQARRGADPQPDIAIESILLGSSSAAVELRDKVKLYAEDNAPILVSGETGVGKELVARELHRLSTRRDGRFRPVNAGGVVETLAASELFGHAKGAFTGAITEREGAVFEADGGVLFLDEIGDMALSVQAQLLRVLDDGVVTKLGSSTGAKIDFRLISATNVDLRKNIAKGAFRRDLFYRISVLVIDVPPLCDRGDDLIEIAESFVRLHPNPKFRNAAITPNAADRLRSHRFPGNIRELRNVLTRALVHAKGGKIFAEHLSFSECGQADSETGRLDITAARDLISRYIVLRALRQTNGNVKKAAEIAGRSRGTVHALVKELNGEDLAAEYDAVSAQLRALVGDC